jgi:lipopolysaccharide export system protein LptA
VIGLAFALILAASRHATPELKLPEGPIHVEAAHLEVLHGRVVTATGGVDLVAPGVKAHADTIIYDRVAGTVDISGNVRVRLLAQGFETPNDVQEATLSADSATFDVRTRAGVLRNAVIEGAGIRLQGKRITRSQSGNYRVDEARFSPCGCKNGTASWEITASRLSARTSGIAILQGGVLRAKGFPVFYLPIGFAPYSSERSTGFLSPQFLEAGRADGVIVTLPFYVAVAPNWDLTVEPGNIEKRGPFVGATGRLANSRGRAETTFVYHRDGEVRRLADELSGNPQDYSPARWFASGRVTQQIGRGLEGKARVDLASDDRYGFDYGLTQMERSRPEYENNVFLDGRNKVLSVVAGSTYYQDLRIIGSAGPYNSAQTVSRLGGLDANLSGAPLLGGSGEALAADADASYDFFDNVSSPQGSFHRGGELEATPRRQVQHVRVHPMFMTPLSLLDDGIRLTTVVGAIADASADPLGGDPRGRFAPQIGADARMEWRRTFEPTGGLKLQHRVGPFLRWRYVPELFGDRNLTSFEDTACRGRPPGDRTGSFLPCGDLPSPGHQIDVGLSNRLFYRSGSDRTEGLPVRELIELEVLERFFPSGPKNGESVVNLDLRTGPLRLDLDGALDNDHGQVTTAGGRAATRSDAPEGVSIEYAYAPDRGSHQATGGGWLKLAEITGSGTGTFSRVLQTLTLEGAARYDFNATANHAYGRSLSTTGGAAYESPCGCWGVRFGAAQETDREGLLKYSWQHDDRSVPITSVRFSIDLHPPTTIRRFTSAPGGS